VASNLTAKTSLDIILRGEIESLVLRNPKLKFSGTTFIFGNKGLRVNARLTRARPLMQSWAR
jgi:hypothetical protein